jgi:four helix bundle protein
MTTRGKKYLKLNDIEAYKISFNLSNYVWNVVNKWNNFEKITLGSQFSRAVDSISANIAEGFGMYNKKDKLRFYRISMGSVFESLDRNEKSKVRKIIRVEDYLFIFDELKRLPKSINNLINFTNERLKV